MTTDDSSNDISIRLAQVADAEPIAALCIQLGYPTTEAAVEQRLLQILPDKTHAVYVAVSDRRVVGWVHIYACQTLMTDMQAVIGGLVVNQSDRTSGIGRRLIQYAEQWAYTSGCHSVLVRSNIVRQAAHHFYEKMGYSTIKTSLVFHKTSSE